MKKQFIYGMLAVAGLSMASCNDFLDDNRWPLDTMPDTPAEWNSEPVVAAECEYFYNNYTGYGNGTSWVNNFIYRSLSDDQSARMNSGSGIVFCDWNYQYAPTSNSTWDDSYAVIRRCNIIIDNVKDNSFAPATKANYIGIARLNRAWQYFDLVRNFGDVCWVNKALTHESEELYGPRVDRNIVMDSVLRDLDFAIAGIATKKNNITFSRDMANAMKSQICLFEAAYAKYHQKDEARAQKYYQEVVKACNAVMDSYSLAPTYRQNYNSMRGVVGALNLQDNPEMIFCKTYIQGTLGHSMIKYISSSTPIAGMTKDAFDAYLFKDGKPLALTDCNKTDVGVAKSNGTIDITNLLNERDGRLGETIDNTLGYTGNLSVRIGSSGSAISDPIASNTGYTIKKYVNPVMTYDQCTNDGSNATCAPIFWLSNIYLDYAEARAELGQFDEPDFEKTINKLYKRAGLNNMTLDKLVTMEDPANNMGVSSLLWEIRRCRRCELMFDNYTRYWDLIRWHKLDLLDTTKYPNIVLGANVSIAPADKKKNVVVNADGYINTAVLSNGTSVRTFSDREYLAPLGTALINLYRDKGINDFKQNPGWEGN